MRLSRQEIKAEIRDITEKVRNKVIDIFGNYTRDIDFSFIDLFSVLLHKEMKHDVNNPEWQGRDRLIISHIRTIPSLLAVLADLGYIKWKDCHDLIISMPKFFATPNMALINYPGVDLIVGDPHTSMVHAMGAALLGQESRTPFRVYHVLPDKRNTKLQEVLMLAAERKMCNLTSIVPDIEMQKRPSTVHFWFSMGWQLEEVRFDDSASIFEGFFRASRAKGKPQIILG